MTDDTMMRVLRAFVLQDTEEKKKLLAEAGAGGWEKYLEFNPKEISSMPQQYRKMFRVNKLRAYMRERRRGGSINYEVRCRMGGLCISAGGTTKEEARAKFIEKLNAGETQKKSEKYKDFCLFYFEKFRKRKVSAETYRCDRDGVSVISSPQSGRRLSGKSPLPTAKTFWTSLLIKAWGKPLTRFSS